MKILRAISFLAVAAVLSTYMGCKPGESTPKPITEVQFDKLNKTWKIQSVTFTGTGAQDRSAEYLASNFTLAIGGTVDAPTYTTSGRIFPSPWKANGTWTFGSAVETQILRDDGVPVDYLVTEATLRLEFNFTGAGYDTRTDQVQGNWVFTFTL